MSMLTTVLPSTSDPTNNILPVVFVVIAIVVMVDFRSQPNTLS